MNSIPRLETDRLKLRAIFPQDELGVFTLFSDPDVVKFYEFEVFREPRQAQTLIQQFTQWFQQDQAVRWGIFEGATDQLIGSCCFDTLNRNYQSANLGYCLRREYWGQGFACEAVTAILDHGFQHGILGALNRVQAITVPANLASEKLLKKLGFQREGLFRSYGFWKGEYHDMNVFSLLKAEWRSNSADH